MGAIANKPTLLTKMTLQMFGGCSLLSPGHGRYGEAGAGREAGRRAEMDRGG